MFFRNKKLKGSISLFLAMIIFLLFILEGFLIDGSKVLAAKQMMSSAGDLALNAGLTCYDEALKDIYGIFAISDSEDDLQKNLENYYKTTLNETTGAVASDGQFDVWLNQLEASLTGEEEIPDTGKLIDLSGTSLSVTKPEASKLSDPAALKMQILEYMKYRAPAGIAYGMLEKVSTFKNIKKEQDVLDKKLTYEEDLSDIEELCKNIYTNVKTYNQILENGLLPENVENKSTWINKKVSELVVLGYCYKAVVGEEKYLTDGADKKYLPGDKWKKKYPNEERETEEELEALLDAIEDSPYWLDMLLADQDAVWSNGGVFEGSDTLVYSTMLAIKTIRIYQSKFDEFRKLYTVCENYKDAAEETQKKSKDEEGEEDGINEELISRYEEDARIISKCTGVLTVVKNKLDGEIKSRFEDILKELYVDNKAASVTIIAGAAKNLISSADLAIGDIDKLLESLTKLNTDRQNWETSVEKLPAGDTRTSMQADINSKAKDLNQQAIRALRQKLVKGKEYASTIATLCKNVQAADFNVVEHKEQTSGEWFRKKGVFAIDEEKLYKGRSMKDGYSIFPLEESVRDALHNSSLPAPHTVYFLRTNQTAGAAENPGKVDLQEFKQNGKGISENITAKNDDFFKYLMRFAPKGSDTKKEDAEKSRDNAYQKISDDDLKVSGAGSLSKTPVTGGNSQTAGENEDNNKGDDPEKRTSTGLGSSDKQRSKNVKAKNKDTVSFLDKVGDLLTDGRNKLYLTQYATEMFSYYTVEFDKDGKKLSTPRESLSKYSFSTDHNAMYKAETEYILWGNTDGNKDVQYTLATIFGIRFLLNSIYAFTGDAEIRSTSLALATSIAGWTGFGVPLVQSVIILGFAVAETASDITLLKQGRSVAIYKSATTWVMKPSNFTKEVVGQTVNNVAKKAENFIFDQVEELTEDKLDEFQSSIEQYMQDTAASVIDTAVATVVTPVKEQLLVLIPTVDKEMVENYTAAELGKIYDETSIENALNGSFTELEKAIDSEPDGLSKKAKKAAVNYVKNNMKDGIMTMIRQVKAEVVGSAGQGADTINQYAENLKNKINTFFSEKEKELRTAVSNAISSEVKQIGDEAKAAVAKGEGEIRDRADAALDKMLMRVDCGISFADTGSSVGGLVPDNYSSSRTSTSAALSMNYKEYLWLFIAVKSMENEDEMIKRMADLIDGNLNKISGYSFDITKASTFLEVNATTNIRTVFFAMPVPQKDGGTKALGASSYQLQYHGLLGY